MGEDGHGTPSAEALSWNLGDLEDHLIQPTQVTDGKTETQRSSYQRISGGSGIRTQASQPSSSSFPTPGYYSKWRCDPESPMPAILACPLLRSHLVSMGIRYLLVANRLALALRSCGPLLVWAPEASGADRFPLPPPLSLLGRSLCLTWTGCVCVCVCVCVRVCA